MKKLLHLLRIGFAVLALAAIITQLERHISFGFNTVNFFSYFTNLSDILFAVFLLAGALIALLGKKQSPLFQFVRGASVLCMLIVGIVFSVLLRNEDLGTLLPWVNIVLHYVMPIVAVLDWFLVPATLTFGWKHIAAWLIFPLAYLVYSLVRGASTNWYPYPFLNPDKVGSTGGVAAYCVGIFALFLIGGWIIAYAARMGSRRQFKSSRAN